MKYKFGEKLRSIREKKKKTIKEVAQTIGVSESLISQIERNKVSPAIDTLLEIVNVLDLDLEYLFSDLKRNKKVHLVKNNERNKMLFPGVIYEQLSRTEKSDDTNGIEAYQITIEPGGQSGSNEYGHKGKELGIILSGSGELRIGNQVYELEEGDSISFDSDIPHAVANTGKGLLKACWITTPPKNLFREM